MSVALAKSDTENIPLADMMIVHDRFHIIQIVSDTVDKVWRAEHKALKPHGDDTLSGTWFVRLTALERLSGLRRERCAAVMDSGSEAGKVRACKEMMLRSSGPFSDEAAALTYVRGWYKRAIHARLKPLKKVTGTIKQRLANIVSYCSHGITNAVA